MPKQVQLRRGTTVQHSTFTGADGELTYDTTKKTPIIHDGATAGGSPIIKRGSATPPGLPAQDINTPLNLLGGDAETYGLAVANQASFNQVIINADAQVKRLFILQEGLLYSASVNIDFQTFGSKRITLAGNITFTASGYLFGASIFMRITCDGTLRTLSFPASWKFVGSAAPASIAANKTALLQLWSFGTTEADIVAHYLVQP